MADQVVLLLVLGVFITAAIASWFDYQEQRIPNKLLIVSMVWFIAVFIYGQVITDWNNTIKTLLRFPLFGMCLVGLVMMIPYRLRQVAAGDVKLAMVFGLYLGPIGGMLTLLNAALFGGIWALWLSWRMGGLSRAFHNIKHMFQSAYTSGFQELGWDLDSDEAITMPYGIALSAGAVSIACWQLWMVLNR